MNFLILFLLMTSPALANQRLQEYQNFLDSVPVERYSEEELRNDPEVLIAHASPIVVTADKETGIQAVMVTPSCECDCDSITVNGEFSDDESQKDNGIESKEEGVGIVQ